MTIIYVEIEHRKPTHNQIKYIDILWPQVFPTLRRFRIYTKRNFGVRYKKDLTFDKASKIIGDLKKRIEKIPDYDPYRGEH